MAPAAPELGNVSRGERQTRSQVSRHSMFCYKENESGLSQSMSSEEFLLQT